MSTPDRESSTQRFAWQAMDRHGRTVQGRLSAGDVHLARAQLRRQGLDNIQMQRLWWDTSATVPRKALAPMTRQLAALLKAGVPLLQALHMLTRSLPSAACTLWSQSWIDPHSFPPCTTSRPNCESTRRGRPPRPAAGIPRAAVPPRRPGRARRVRPALAGSLRRTRADEW